MVAGNFIRGVTFVLRRKGKGDSEGSLPQAGGSMSKAQRPNGARLGPHSPIKQ